MSKPSSIAKQLDKLANKIAEEALNTVSLHDRMDAFKILTGYYTSTSKLPAEKDTKNQKGTFDDYREQVETGGREPGHA